MIEETKPASSCCQQAGHSTTGGVFGGAYGLAFIGAAIYYIQHADTFWTGVVGILKAMVWPAFLIYRLLEFLNM
jgi:hypothetical protein